MTARVRWGVAWAAAVVALVVGTCAPAQGAGTRPARPSAPAPKLPALPHVPRWVTDGQPEQSLYRQALSLAAVGRHDAALVSEVAANQAVLDADAVMARQADRAARRARRAAEGAARAAGVAGSRFDSLAAALRRSALNLYVSGAAADGAIGTEQSSDDLAWAAGLLESTVSPTGVLARRAEELGLRQRESRLARRESTLASSAAARVRRAEHSERAAGARLLADLQAVDSTGAAAVAADHTLLAAQAGQLLADPRALEFRPRAELPAPLHTTDVALTWAFAELGVQYLWGGTGAGGFDCSGLTQYVWRKAGVTIPRVAADQDAWADPVPLSQLSPGDLVFYGTSYIHHVGIYIGAGLMINAPHTGTVVQVSSIWWSDLAGFGRVHADGTPVASHQIPTPADPVRGVVLTSRRVPSETKPPLGWKPPHHGKAAATSTSSSTSAPRRGTGGSTASTTLPLPSVTSVGSASPSSSTTSTTTTTTTPTTTTTTTATTAVPAVTSTIGATSGATSGSSGASGTTGSAAAG